MPMNNEVTVGKVNRLTFIVLGKAYTQDVLVTATADGDVTGHRIVKKTGQPEKQIGTWPAANIHSVQVAS
jgi:hypothetical protein